MSDTEEHSVPYMLGRMDAKLDMLLESKKGHDKRLGWLEKKSYIAYGVIMMLCTFVVPKARVVLGL